jgi:hypothetical protein
VSRRVTLPGADELFGSTEKPSRAEPPSPAAGDGQSATGPSGRIRHDEKITVYVTADELLDLEHTRLSLRRDHGLAVDRGRLVREAIHLALEDAATNGSDSALVRRLTAS